MPYCSDCGAKLEESIGEFCKNCVPVEISTISIPKFVPIKKQDIFTNLAKLFFPFIKPALSHLIPKNDEIFSALILKGFIEQTTMTGAARKVAKYWWNSPILITKLGIAYNQGNVFNANNQRFDYWDKINIFTGTKLRIKGNNFAFNNMLIKLYSFENFKTIYDNLSPFCKILRNAFMSYLRTMEKCVKNVEIVKKIIDNQGIKNFITDLEIYSSKLFNDASRKVENKKGEKRLKLDRKLRLKASVKPLKIIDNAIEICQNDEKKLFLELISKIKKEALIYT